MRYIPFQLQLWLQKPLNSVLFNFKTISQTYIALISRIKGSLG